MGTCPDCSFDGTNGKQGENNQFPNGYASEGRIMLGNDGRMLRNPDGSPKWGTRSRCPLCGCTAKKASSKPKTTKEIEV